MKDTKTPDKSNWNPCEFSDATDPEQITFSKEEIFSGRMFTRKQLMDSLVRVTEQLQGCVEGLRFYADKKTYMSKHGGHIENKNFKSAIGRDCGHKASELLNKIDQEDQE